jgi:FtsH-binding integral membrane protein
MTISSAAAPRRYPGRLFLALGLGLAVLGIIAYAVQIATARLTAPWYMPCLATLGVVFLAIALWQARSVWRILALLLVLLLAGAEWAFLLGTRLPAYTGPVAAARPFPNFATMRADGTTFTQRDLEGDQNNILVFFRGRW